MSQNSEPFFLALRNSAAYSRRNPKETGVIEHRLFPFEHIRTCPLALDRTLSHVLFTSGHLAGRIPQLCQPFPEVFQVS